MRNDLIRQYFIYKCFAKCLSKNEIIGLDIWVITKLLFNKLIHEILNFLEKYYNLFKTKILTHYWHNSIVEVKYASIRFRLDTQLMCNITVGHQ